MWELATTDSREDRDFGARSKASGEVASVADVLVADKDVDMFAETAFFGDNAVADTRIFLPKFIEGVAQSFGRVFKFDPRAASGERS